MKTSIRKLTFTEACAKYVHRFTFDHTPSWARTQRPDGTYYAPQYSSDREWYDNTIFKGEEGYFGTHGDCCSINQTWPLGQSLPEPYSATKHRPL